MIHIEIDSSNIQALKLLEYLRLLPFVRIIEDEEPVPNKETLKALDDAHKGKGTVANNFDELMKFLND